MWNTSFKTFELIWSVLTEYITSISQRLHYANLTWSIVEYFVSFVYIHFLCCSFDNTFFTKYLLKIIRGIFQLKLYREKIFSNCRKFVSRDILKKVAKLVILFRVDWSAGAYLECCETSERFCEHS